MQTLEVIVEVEPLYDKFVQIVRQLCLNSDSTREWDVSCGTTFHLGFVLGRVLFSFRFRSGSSFVFICVSFWVEFCFHLCFVLGRVLFSFKFHSGYSFVFICVSFWVEFCFHLCFVLGRVLFSFKFHSGYSFVFICVSFWDELCSHLSFVLGSLFFWITMFRYGKFGAASRGYNKNFLSLFCCLDHFPKIADTPPTLIKC